MKPTIKITLAAVLASASCIVASGCGRNATQVEQLGSGLATLEIKAPVDQTGLLKAGTDFDAIEVQIKEDNSNARWTTKTRMSVKADTSSSDPALSLKPGTYYFNLLLIDTKTNKVMALAQSGRAECDTPKATLKAGKNDALKIAVCVQKEPVAPTPPEVPGQPGTGEADVVFEPVVVHSSSVASRLTTTISGTFTDQTGAATVSIKNPLATDTSCSIALLWKSEDAKGEKKAFIDNDKNNFTLKGNGEAVSLEFEVDLKRQGTGDYRFAAVEIEALLQCGDDTQRTSAAKIALKKR